MTKYLVCNPNGSMNIIYLSDTISDFLEWLQENGFIDKETYIKEIHADEIPKITF